MFKPRVVDQLRTLVAEKLNNGLFSACVSDYNPGVTTGYTVLAFPDNNGLLAILRVPLLTSPPKMTPEIPKFPLKKVKYFIFLLFFVIN